MVTTTLDDSVPPLTEAQTSTDPSPSLTEYCDASIVILGPARQTLRVSHCNILLEDSVSCAIAVYVVGVIMFGWRRRIGLLSY